MGYLTIIFKSITVYLFIVFALRIFGKKELAQLSTSDLVFILLISNSVQNAMVGSDTSLSGGITAALGLFIINYIFKHFLTRSPRFSKFIQGEKIFLIHDGEIVKRGLKLAMMSQEELESAMRAHGIKDISKIDLAILECNGNISILTKDFKEKTILPRTFLDDE